MLGDIYLLAAHQCRFHLLSENSSGGEPSHQLQATLAALIDAPLVNEDLVRDVFEAAGGGGAAVDVGQ
jgi:hypothetical protein